MDTKNRNWCYTLNNYSEAEWDAFKALPCRYHAMGKEIGESGTPHIQGFICFANVKTFSAVKKILGIRAHIEPMRGTFEQASKYCLKDSGDHFEGGKLPLDQPAKGKVEVDRWTTALTQARSTGDVEDSQIAFVHCKNIQWLYHAAEMKKPRVDTEEKMLWYWGETGTGKSRKARTDYPDAYLKMCNKWWDGYNGEEVAIIEDFDLSHSVLCHHLKIWADRYPFLGEVKGAGRKIRPRLIIVTSNWHPSEIWQAPPDLNPILRRFTITEFKKLNDFS